MSEPVTVDDVRRIVREEHIRALRLSLSIMERVRLGYAVSPAVLDEPPAGVTVSGLQLDVLNYREGR